MNKIDEIVDTSSSESSSEDEATVDITERADLPHHLQSPVDRLRDLRQRLATSSQANQREVYQEHQRKHENPAEQRKQDRKRREALALQQRLEYTGDDYERSRFKDYSIEQVERYEQKRKRRQDNKELGFTDYAQVNQRKYERDVAKLKPQGITEQHGPERLAQLVGLQQKKRDSLHKPSIEKEGEDVSYINQRNAHFNRKMNRAYDKHTKEVRDNLERGTAL